MLDYSSISHFLITLPGINIKKGSVLVTLTSFDLHISTKDEWSIENTWDYEYKLEIIKSLLSTLA